MEDGDDVDDEYDDYGNFVENEAWEYGKENVGPVASPYPMPYFYKRLFSTRNMAAVRTVICLCQLFNRHFA